MREVRTRDSEDPESLTATRVPLVFSGSEAAENPGFFFFVVKALELEAFPCADE